MASYLDVAYKITQEFLRTHLQFKVCIGINGMLNAGKEISFIDWIS